MYTLIHYTYTLYNKSSNHSKKNDTIQKVLKKESFNFNMKVKKFRFFLFKKNIKAFNKL